MSIRRDLPKDHERRFQARLRAERMALARALGWTFAAIGEAEGVTRERVRQILAARECAIRNELIRLLPLRSFLAEVANG